MVHTFRTSKKDAKYIYELDAVAKAKGWDKIETKEKKIYSKGDVEVILMNFKNGYKAIVMKDNKVIDTDIQKKGRSDLFFLFANEALILPF